MLDSGAVKKLLGQLQRCWRREISCPARSHGQDCNVVVLTTDLLSYYWQAVPNIKVQGSSATVSLTKQEQLQQLEKILLVVLAQPPRWIIAAVAGRGIGSGSGSGSLHENRVAQVRDFLLQYLLPERAAFVAVRNNDELLQIVQTHLVSGVEQVGELRESSVAAAAATAFTSDIGRPVDVTIQAAEKFLQTFRTLVQAWNANTAGKNRCLLIVKPEAMDDLGGRGAEVGTSESYRAKKVVQLATHLSIEEAYPKKKGLPALSSFFSSPVPSFLVAVENANVVTAAHAAASCTAVEDLIQQLLEMRLTIFMYITEADPVGSAIAAMTREPLVGLMKDYLLRNVFQNDDRRFEIKSRELTTAQDLLELDANGI
mmetsp:Transcript_1986/g.4597  ORF Transcript_1986/g.4597 Transcript_1986/m.4597 type:complete len:371 (+) Transcript_1986:131-1243(+)|eukprot:g8990.t1